jgi:hypothetical protein
MRFAAVILALLASVPAAAQITNRPTDPPVVTAENDSWYRLREPLVFAGDLYYPVGPQVFFNGNVMVRTGHYNGVPLYADTTLEPYSIVFVPVGRGVMQPYERVRGGDLSGTSGSRPSSVPGRTDRGASGIAAAAGSPSNPPLPIGAVSVYTPDGREIPAAGRVIEGPAAAAFAAPVVAPVVARPRKPLARTSIWIEFDGKRWVNAGPSVAADALALQQVGVHQGFPVYRLKGVEDARIFVPMGSGLVSPFLPQD